MPSRPERDLYDWYATKLSKMLVRTDGEFSVVNEELSWEMRARLAEEKLQALIDGLKSDEGWVEMMNNNPIGRSIATVAIKRYVAGQ
jgi:hypothetical protein